MPSSFQADFKGWLADPSQGSLEVVSDCVQEVEALVLSTKGKAECVWVASGQVAHVRFIKKDWQPSQEKVDGMAQMAQSADGDAATK